MDFTGLMLVFVVMGISGVTFALLGIRKSLDRLAAEIRNSNSMAKHRGEEANKPDAGYS